MAKDGDIERRRDARSALHLPVICRVPATPRQATILNISTAGCLIRSLGKMEVGSTILVALPFWKETEGMVVWSRDGCAGVRFQEGLSAELVEAIATLPDATRIARVA